MEGRRSNRFPSKEELELWAHVTREDEPLSRLGREPSPGAPPNTPAAVRPSKAPDAPIPAPRLSGKPRATRAAKPMPPTPPASFDRRVVRRIARGSREIDARLDLHGLRQQDAYAALRRFLAHCQTQGHRHVLIITGKGLKADAHEERDFWESEQRGVLRRLVPQWLSEPVFRTHVVSFTESALKHGGSGALYVTIRKAI
jgi:DNA-nicking Smr family endonuclease